MADRLNEYFASEAREYLDELERLLTGSPTPEADQFFRLATGIRGSAQMAEAQGVVVLAEALEDAARGLASGAASWSEELQSLALGTVHDLKELVGALGRWGSPEDERLRSAVSRWDRTAHASSGSGQEQPPVPISELFYDDAGPHVLHPAPGAIDDDPRAADETPGLSATDAGSLRTAAVEDARGDAIPIGELLYQGPTAFREALALRPRIREAARQGPSTSLDDLLEELFDLVELGMGPDRPE